MTVNDVTKCLIVPFRQGQDHAMVLGPVLSRHLEVMTKMVGYETSRAPNAVIQPPTLQVIHQGTYSAPSAIMLASKSVAVMIDAVLLTHVSLI